uniref:SRPBCC family protein n=1 Tax=Nocardioides sp. TaxID=35761 RepID=UPI002B2725D6
GHDERVVSVRGAPVDLEHRFTVPTGVEETWTHFQDLAALAECFPGATLTDSDDTSFSGSVKVKLGPIALVYNGSGTFVDKDEESHTFQVEAKGKDKRGNGTAGAKVLLSMTGTPDGSTEVEVVTDLAITGKPAQFGRGVMQDVSDKLLGQFVSCLEQRLSGEPEGAADTTGVGDAVPTPTAEAAAATTEVAAPAAAATVAAAAPKGAPPQGQDDALDLGAAVLPVLLKGYWKQALAGLVAVALVGRVVRGLRRRG